MQNIKKVFTFMVLLIVVSSIFGQVPSSFKYQAVLRDARGNIKANIATQITISVLKENANGTVVFSETHDAITDGYGLINLEIGKGTPTVGTLSDIDWGVSTYFIKVNVDGVEMGTSQLLSVPYALYAKTAGNVTGNITETDPVFTGSQAAIITANHITKLNNLSGVNTGDQNLSGLATTASLTSTLGNKVDKVAGKGLSANDYTNTEKTKLTAINGTNTGDQDIAAMAHSNRTALDAVTGKNTGDQNLSGLATISSVTTTLNNKVDKVAGKGLSANDYTTAEKTKLTAITGSNTGDQDVTAMTHSNRVALDSVTGKNTGDQDLASVLVKGTDAGNKKIVNAIQLGVGTVTPDLSSALEIKSTTQGFLPPRMTYVQKLAIVSPASGLLIWCSNCGVSGEIQVFNGSTWTNIIGGFTTASLPIISLTTSVYSITKTTATSGGSVTSDGGATITSRGVCWSTKVNPTVAFSTKTIDGTGTGVFSSSLTGLSADSTYYVRAYATNSVGTVYGSSITFTTITNHVVPTLTTVATTNIAQTTATSGGNVTSDGGTIITACGVCWSTSVNPTVALSTKTSNGTGTGAFTSSLTGLTAGITYYGRAYATNSAGTSYGNELTFTTLANPIIPTLATTAATNITQTTATSGGNVTSDGGAIITARGVCWSTAVNPTIALSTKTSNGTGTGIFSSSISGLTAGTTYYLRAYSTNSAGTVYGAELSFKTSIESGVTTVTDIDGNVYNTVTIGTQVWMVGNLKTTKYRNGDPIPNVTNSTSWAALNTGAYCWSNNDLANKADYGALYNWYSVSDIRNIAPTGWHVATDAEWSDLTAFLGGESVAGSKLKEKNLSHWLSPNTDATNVTGFTALPGADRGMYGTFGNIGIFGLWWTASESSVVGAWARVLSNSNGLITSIDTNKPAGFSVRCLKDDNSAGVAIPIVNTATTSSITTLSAVSGGNISKDGGTSIIARGVCWSSSTNPTVALRTKTSDGAGTGIFSSSLAGLVAGTNYYVRAYATNSSGTYYGNRLAFTTLNSVSTLTTMVVLSIAQTTATSGGNVTADGGARITARGVCWSTAVNPTVTLSTKTNDGTGIGTFSSSLTGLTAGTNYYVRAYATNSIGTSYGSSITFSTITNHVVPTLTTTTTTNVAQTTATSGGNVTSDGGTIITARGVCWSTKVNPTVALNTKTTNGTGTGIFSSSLTGLGADSTYYVRAYATNSTGTSYGSSIIFTTITNHVVPSLTTTAATNIAQTTVTSGGNVTSDGGATITARGICWSTAVNPTVALNTKTSNGTGTGIFSSSLTGLTAGITYYMRAYATNSAGTSYGNELTFTTLANPVIPTLATTAATNITQTTATSGGNVTADGGARITARGVCWSTAVNPTVTLSTKTNDGTGIGTFSSSLTGLTAGTNYYVRAYATNSAGTSYGNSLTFTTLANPVVPTLSTTVATNITQTTATSGGNVTADGGAAITARGVCWSTIQNPTTTNTKTSNGTGKGSFVSALTGLTQGTTYYIRAYATNSVGTTYGNQTIAATIKIITAPIIYKTVSISSITATTAISGGIITSDGGSALTARGVCWSKSPNATIANSKTTDGFGIADFTSNLTGLSANTDYYLRAYATNQVGTGYGVELFFRTSTASAGTTVTDIDGNVYHTVTIGTQVWMVENLKTTKYRNGDLIGTTTPATLDIAAENAPKYQWAYDGNISNADIYGRLYTWYVANDSRGACPIGWKVPSASDLFDLNMNSGDANDAGYFLKEKGTTHWNAPTSDPTNSLVTNRSGFTGLPSGGRLTDGIFYALHETAVFCTTDESSSTVGQSRNLNATNLNNIFVPTALDKKFGISVRCLKDDNPAGVVLPTLNTETTRSITTNSAISGGNISSDGGAAITARGVCWSTSANPTVALSTKTSDGTGTGVFTSSLTGLTAGTNYYVRAYATNSAGTSYGNELTFATLANPVIPTLTTSAVTNITQTTATSGGNVTSDGGATITARGICWSTAVNPTIALSTKTSNGTGTGIFSSSISGLTAGTTYYSRAYSTNSTGTVYGAELSFKTSIESGVTTVTDIDGNVYHTVTIGMQVWMVENLQTTKYNDNTSIPLIFDANIWSNLSTPAYCWYNNDVTNRNPYGALYNWYTVNTGKLAPIGWHVASNAEWATLIDFLGGSSIAGGKLKEAGNSHFQSSNYGATNETGFTALPGGSISGNTTVGYIFSSLGSTGVWWTSTEEDTGNAWKLMMHYPGNNVDRFASDKKFGASVRCVKDFDPQSALIPTLNTTIAGSVTSTSANSGGNIISDGGASITARGVCWSTSANPTISLSTKTSDGTGLGSFTSTITGLIQGTTYYIRAYATNSAGTAYGTQMTATTINIPSLTTTTITAITANSAASGGIITSDGGATITERGVCWSTFANPTVSLSTKTYDGNWTNEFASSLTELTEGKTYFMRAYATNSAGTAYGIQLSFIAKTTVITIGQAYKGGVVAYIYKLHEPGYVEGQTHGLIAALSDQSTGIQWYNGGNYIEVHAVYMSGNSNTLVIVSSLGEGNYAAKLCVDLRIGGYNGWFLPSDWELNQLYINRLAIGGFTNNDYWSSGEVSNTQAYFKVFSTGQTGYGSKDNLMHVRAVREF